MKVGIQCTYIELSSGRQGALRRVEFRDVDGEQPVSRCDGHVAGNGDRTLGCGTGVSGDTSLYRAAGGLEIRSLKRHIKPTGSLAYERGDRAALERQQSLNIKVGEIDGYFRCGRRVKCDRRITV